MRVAAGKSQVVKVVGMPFEDESGVSLKPWDKARRTLTDENAVLESMFDNYF